MKSLLLLACLFLFQQVYAQQLDSIKYENGYLYFHKYGKGEPVIILTGGPGASYLQMEPVARQLSKMNQAILLEQRGTGRSQPQPYDTSTVNIRTARQDIIRLLDYLHLKQAHLLGHSWGGMLAMNFAAVFPDRVKSLILVSSGPFHLDARLGEMHAANMEARLSQEDRKARAAVMQKWRDGTATEKEKEAVYKWELIPVLYDRTKVDSLITIINKGGLNPRTGGMLIQSFMQSKIDVGAKLGQLKAPIYIISGAQDPGSFVSYEIKLVAPQAQLNWINRAGHFPMYEQPEEFYRVLTRVFSK